MPDGANKTEEVRFDAGAEAACLSWALIEHDAALELITLLSEGDYYGDANRQIHRAVREVASRGDRVDIVAVVAQLRASDRLGRVGGPQAVQSLLEIATSARLPQYAKIVKNWARVRRARNTFRLLAAEAQTADLTDVDAWLDSCERRAYEATASEEVAKDHSASYRDAWATMQAKWAEADSRDDKTLGVATGFSRLDEHTGGMRSGQLWYVGARPGQGKTAFAQQIVEYVAIRGAGKDAGVLDSQEMTIGELIPRALARRSGHGHRKIERRTLDRAAWDDVTQAAQTLHLLPIEIDDQKAITPLQLAAKIRRATAKMASYAPQAKLRVVAVDYVQLMRPDIDRGENRATELGKISRALKEMAGEFECTMLVLSQLARHTDKSKPPPVPSLFDFRDSGSIEADGDVVLGLHRPDQWRKPNEEPDHRCQVHVLKGRGCGENAFELKFDGPTTAFENIDPNDDKLWRNAE